MWSVGSSKILEITFLYVSSVMCIIFNDGYYICPPDHFEQRHIKAV